MDESLQVAQARSIYETLLATTNMTAEEFKLFSALEEIFDTALMRQRKRLEIADFRNEVRLARQGRENRPF